MQTLKYFQEKQQFWRSIHEVIKNSHFEEIKLFPTTFLNQCRNNLNEPQNIPNEIKAALKKWLWNRGCMPKLLLSTERSQIIKRESKIPRNITSTDNHQAQDVGQILIMSVKKKMSGHVKQISIENFIKNNLGVMIQKHTKYLE